MNLLLSLGLSLLFTECVELTLALLFRKWGRELGVVAAANLLTNPLLVFLWHLSCKNLFVLLLMEAGAVWAEGFCYKKCTAFRHPYAFSLVCNLISFMIGELL